MPFFLARKNWIQVGPGPGRHPGIVSLESGHQWLAALMVFDTASVRAKVCLLFTACYLVCGFVCCVYCTAFTKTDDTPGDSLCSNTCLHVSAGCDASFLSHFASKMNQTIVQRNFI